MRRVMTFLATVALTVACLSTPATAGRVPTEFGSDWDDPRTAVKPVEKPNTDSCEVTLVDHAFDDFEPVEGRYRPPRDCGREWSKVVLRLDGAVKGRQFDRLGRLTIGGVPVFATSTPQPSPEGIEWSQEKDLSGYAALLAKPHDTVMTLGNAVDDTYTGVLDVKVTVTFYATDRRNPPIEAAETVLPLRDADTGGSDLTGKLRTPRNTERLLADVYATGSGGGCEEFWYLAAPPDSGYSCQSEEGPNREVRVYIDGELAGLAAPYPHVYTGGWSNPFLWYTLPAPRAFDLRPLTLDLTPYLGQLNDGGSHEVRVKVAGVDEESEGWSTPVAFRGWVDEGSKIVRGGLMDSRTGAAVNDVDYSEGETDTVLVRAGHSHTATGWLATSHGNLLTTVERTVGMRSTHTWGPGENPDALSADFTDTETVSVLSGDGRATERTISRGFGVDGRIGVTGDGRLTTSIELSDDTNVDTTGWAGDTSHYDVTDTYTGEASYLLDVPRPDRHAEGVSKHRYRIGGDADCYDRTIATRNGHVTRDSDRCRSASG